MSPETRLRNQIKSRRSSAAFSVDSPIAPIGPGAATLVFGFINFHFTSITPANSTQNTNTRAARAKFPGLLASSFVRERGAIWIKNHLYDVPKNIAPHIAPALPNKLFHPRPMLGQSASNAIYAFWGPRATRFHPHQIALAM